MVSVSVVHTIDSVAAEQGGPSRSVPALVQALRGAGVEASLSSYEDGASHVCIAANLIHDHGLWLPSNHAAARAARRWRIPIVVSPRGMLEPWALAQKRWKKQAAWALYQRADLAQAVAIHATSAAEAESVRAAGIRAPVAIVPNGVSVPDALPPRRTGSVRRALFLSRIHPVKGLPLLVEAWDRVRPAGWELVIAGPDEGGHRAKVEALVQGSGVSDAVRFVGPVSDADKWALYRTADLVVLPTHSENFGLVIAEALGAGVPVLTTTGAPWRALEQEQCGWWVAPAAEAIAEALSAATSLPRSSLDEMGDRGRAVVARDFGWASVAVQMCAIYAWLLGEGERPDTVDT